EIGLTEAERRIDVLDAALGKEVDLFGEGSFDHVGGARNDGARGVVHRVFHERGHVREDREKHVVERLVARGVVLFKQQVVHVGLHDLAGEARIDRAVLSAFGEHFFGCFVTEDNVRFAEAQTFKIGAEERRRRVHVEHTWHTDAEPLEALCGFSTYSRYTARRS